MNQPLLICGNDVTLLATRKLLLEHAGLRVQIVVGVPKSSFSEAKALLLCYSLSRSEQIEAVRRFRLRCPDGRVLILGGESREIPCSRCESLAPYPGPETLLEATRALMQ